jgi:DNA replication and repair protein RecF
MFLKEVRIHEFRNFDQLSLKLNERVNFFVGNNGQGKTNFLEAVYLLSRGNTFRPSENKSLVNFNSKNRISIRIFSIAFGTERFK